MGYIKREIKRMDIRRIPMDLEGMVLKMVYK